MDHVFQIAVLDNIIIHLLSRVSHALLIAISVIKLINALNVVLGIFIILQARLVLTDAYITKLFYFFLFLFIVKKVLECDHLEL